MNGISHQTAGEVMDRAGGACENPKCGTSQIAHYHHIFFRSQYFGDDRHGPWNIALLCEKCHASIHHTGGGAELNFYLKKAAYDRYTGEERRRRQLMTLLQIAEYKAKTL